MLPNFVQPRYDPLPPPPHLTLYCLVISWSFLGGSFLRLKKVYLPQSPELRGTPNSGLRKNRHYLAANLATHQKKTVALGLCHGLLVMQTLSDIL